MSALKAISAGLRARENWVAFVAPLTQDGTPPSLLLTQDPTTDLRLLPVNRGAHDLVVSRKAYMVAYQNVPRDRALVGYELTAGDGLVVLTCRGAIDLETGELRPDVRADLEQLGSYAEVGRHPGDVTVVVEADLGELGVQTAGEWTLATGHAVAVLTGQILPGVPADPQPREAELRTWWAGRCPPVDAGTETVQVTPPKAAPTEATTESTPAAVAAVPETTGGSDRESKGRKSTVMMAVDLVREAGGTFLIDDQQRPYLSLPIDDKITHLRLPGADAEQAIRKLVYLGTDAAMSQQAVKETLTLLATIALDEAAVSSVGTRVVHHDGVTYLDLGNAAREIVRIAPEGWDIIPDELCPVAFLRPRSLAALPRPTRGGSLLDLGTVLNLRAADDGVAHDLVLVAAWLIGVLAGVKPFPLLVVNGEAGSGKSYATRLVRDLTDPRAADVRALPRSEQDLAISAQHLHVLAYDNASSISPELSDALCRLATGGAFASRTLYSSDEETVLMACRPVVVNGIPDLLSQPDLADRSLSITLRRVPDHLRQTEREVRARFETLRPSILGALLDAVVVGLRDRDTVSTAGLPRMADFAQLVIAAETACPWPAGTFMRAYTAAQMVVAGGLLDGNEFGAAVRELVERCGQWKGNYQALLETLSVNYDTRRPLPRGWPANPKAASTALRRVAPALRQLGIAVEFGERSSAGATVMLTAARAPTPRASDDTRPPTLKLSVEADTAIRHAGVVVGEV